MHIATCTRIINERDRLEAALRRTCAGNDPEEEDIGASMLIAEELGPCLGVPVEIVPLEELEKILETSSNGTVVTSRYFLQQVESLAKKHNVRSVAIDPNEFGQELELLKGLRTGSCVGLVSISPGILRAAEIILHSMRGANFFL